MTRQPRFSVVIPSFNEATTIERAICSVLDQGYENSELIVIDGGSDDGTVEMIRRYEGEIDHWESQFDSGPAEAINRGLVHATGDYICILGADDLLLPEALHHVAQWLSREGDVAWLIGDAVRIDGHDQQLGPVTAEAPAALSNFLRHDGGVMPGPATFYRASLFGELGGLSESRPFAYRYEFACRLIARNCLPRVIGTSLAAIRDQAGRDSISRVLAAGRELIETAEAYADHLPTGERYGLWKNCDERRRIYALAEAEASGSKSRRFLWQQLLRHPWWLASEHYRQSLLRGISHDGDATAAQAA